MNKKCQKCYSSEVEYNGYHNFKKDFLEVTLRCVECKTGTLKVFFEEDKSLMDKIKDWL